MLVKRIGFVEQYCTTHLHQSRCNAIACKSVDHFQFVVDILSVLRPDFRVNLFNCIHFSQLA